MRSAGLGLGWQEQGWGDGGGGLGWGVGRLWAGVAAGVPLGVDSLGGRQRERKGRQVGCVEGKGGMRL